MIQVDPVCIRCDRGGIVKELLIMFMLCDIITRLIPREEIKTFIFVTDNIHLFTHFYTEKGFLS